MRGDWMDQARRFEDIDRAVMRKIERKELREAMDWTFTPTAAQLEDLNKLRDYHRLPRIEKVTRASEWFRACFEIDECAEASTPNSEIACGTPSRAAERSTTETQPQQKGA